MIKHVPRLKKRFTKGFFVLIFLLLVSLVGFARDVGINSTIEPANPAMKSDINFTNTGFLRYMISLPAISNPAPFTPHHLVEMVVYNTPNSENVTKGMFNNDGTKYIVLPAGLSQVDVQNWKWITCGIIPTWKPGQKLKLNSSGVPECIKIYLIN